MDALLPYVKSPAFFSKCPSKNFPDWKPSPLIPGQPSRTNVAFAANSIYAQIQDAVDGQTTTPPMRESGVALAAMAVPADTIVLGDGSGYYIAYTEDKNRTLVEVQPPFNANVGLPNIGRQSDVNA